MSDCSIYILIICRRTLNDTLELTEISLDHNLFDNQVRYIFRNSPIVGPITIHETETNIVILVATVTTVHKFIFIHPKRMPEVSNNKKFSISSDKKRMHLNILSVYCFLQLPLEKTIGNNKPSIFYQMCNKPQMSFRSFNLFENAISKPKFVASF